MDDLETTLEHTFVNFARLRLLLSLPRLAHPLPSTPLQLPHQPLSQQPLPVPILRSDLSFLGTPLALAQQPSFLRSDRPLDERVSLLELCEDVGRARPGEEGERAGRDDRGHGRVELGEQASVLGLREPGQEVGLSELLEMAVVDGRRNEQLTDCKKWARICFRSWSNWPDFLNASARAVGVVSPGWGVEACEEDMMDSDVSLNGVRRALDGVDD